MMHDLLVSADDVNNRLRFLRVEGSEAPTEVGVLHGGGDLTGLNGRAIWSLWRRDGHKVDDDASDQEDGEQDGHHNGESSEVGQLLVGLSHILQSSIHDELVSVAGKNIQCLGKALVSQVFFKHSPDGITGLVSVLL